MNYPNHIQIKADFIKLPYLKHIYFQKYEIAAQKKRLDSNLLQISQQLIILQKSLQRKEKTFLKTLRRKDKVR